MGCLEAVLSALGRYFGEGGGLPGPSWAGLVGFVSRPGPLWASLGRLLEARRAAEGTGLLGRLRGSWDFWRLSSAWLVSILARGAPWIVLGRSGGFTAASWVILGPSGGVSGPSERELEAVWGPHG